MEKKSFIVIPTLFKKDLGVGKLSLSVTLFIMLPSFKDLLVLNTLNYFRAYFP